MTNQINFVNTSDITLVADFIADLVIDKLKLNQRVLWLVPGGSSISVAALAAEKIAKYDHHKLTVTLTDERYGALDHPDSNWRQLREAGFFLPEAKLIPVLANDDFLTSAQNFAINLERAFLNNDYVIGFFGIGPDGHTAGILPGSPAVTSSELTCAYDAGNFKRITITPKAVAYLNEAIVFAQGEFKWPTLKQLNQELPLTTQPAQVLKTLKKLTIFSDYQN